MPIITLENLTVSYSGKQVIEPINLVIEPNSVTGIIGPSGCGKSTILRSMNRMNEIILGCTTDGRVLYKGEDLYERSIDPVAVRFEIGMVFQKPNPFPKSIYDNVAFGPRMTGYKGKIDELVEYSLTKAALWDEVKDRLKKSALELSGGQQQRLCIARTLANNPNVILMDEPCSALDPQATNKIEGLISELKKEHTIIIVTHNMQQAGRISDFVAFINFQERGYLHRFGSAREIFTMPTDKITEDYITGRFG